MSRFKADQETEINGTGPNVEPAQLEELKAILSSLTADDTVAFAGSSAKNLGNVIYKDLIRLDTPDWCASGLVILKDRP